MYISGPFIKRPIGTTLLVIAMLMVGAIAYTLLPVAALPDVDFPTIQVSAGLPGASPETMASAVATPLERQFTRIAGVTDMTSSSLLGSTSVTLQFDLSRNIDAAARDVQAAINASAGQLPADLPVLPRYRKVNPADSPIIIFSVTSSTLPLSQIYDITNTVVAQKLSQVQGVGQVGVNGGSAPAVRVELNPSVLAHYGISLEEVRTSLGQVNADMPKGTFSNNNTFSFIAANDQLFTAEQYRPLIVAYRHGAPVRLSDIADVRDSVENAYAAGLLNGNPCILMFAFRQPGANIVQTVDNIYAALPQIKNSIPPTITIGIEHDRTTMIRASVHDIQVTLLITVALVVLVIFVFLRSLWSTIIPAIAVPVSLVGTFAIMYGLGYSIDNLSLMALTIVTGFVVDDAIVVIENITRYIEAGMSPFQAALRGSREIGFTVVSMSTSLVAVFIPVMLMGGVVGKLFREFAVTLSVAVGVSLVVSLTATPMMCAHFLKPVKKEGHNWIYRLNENAFNKLHSAYNRGLLWVLRHRRLTLAVTVATLCLSVYLYIYIPKGFFPQQDTGALGGAIQAAQDISYDAMRKKQVQFSQIVVNDPAVEGVTSFVGGGGQMNRGTMIIHLKPLEERKVSADDVINRLRQKLAVVPGATLFLQSMQDLQIGGRPGNSQYQYTLQSENLGDLNTWAPRMFAKMRTLPQLRDVSTDQQDQGLEARLVIDRDTASRLGIPAATIDNTLYDAFGQRQVSTIYAPLNQYHVVMEVAPSFQENPDSLQGIYVQSITGAEVPLSAFTHYDPQKTGLAVNHQGQFPAVTLSFNLAPGVALGDAAQAVQDAQREMGFPSSIEASFRGTAQAFQDSTRNQPVLVLGALVAVYIVLGMLYESLIHPITILSTLPSAGVGALLALMICKTELSVIALIGIILLIGIVKKNAIMMVDFAIDTERKNHKSPEDAIYEACLLRFRPIMMTTMAALLGGLPLALGHGTGSELRRPLGISIVGGLIVSQMLTLFTTPVVYLYMDRLGLWFSSKWRTRGHREPALPTGLHPSDSTSD